MSEIKKDETPLTLDALLAKLAELAQTEQELARLLAENARLKTDLDNAMAFEYDQQYHYTVVVGEVDRHREIRSHDETFCVRGDLFRDVLQPGMRVFAIGEVELDTEDGGCQLYFTPYSVRPLIRSG